MDILKKGIVVTIIALTVGGCADEYENRYSRFEQLSLLGVEASCSEVLSTVTEVELGGITPQQPRYTRSFDVIDYMRDTGNSFPHCEAELKPVLTKECLRVVDQRYNDIRNRVVGGWPSRSGHERLCIGQLSAMYTKFQDSYEFSNSKGYLTLKKGNAVVALRPENIDQIDFNEIIANHVWSAEIQTNKGTEVLLFSDQVKWKSAIENLTNL